MALGHRTRKDYYAATTLLLLGAGVIYKGASYGVGTLTQMGAGYIPVVLGVLLIILGASLGLTARLSTQAMASDLQVPGAHGPLRVEWRGWLCIIGGVCAFVLLGVYGGLVPAAFAAVFIAALGDRKNTAKDAALLAAAMTVAGALIFRIGLNMQLPLFSWGT